MIRRSKRELSRNKRQEKKLFKKVVSSLYPSGDPWRVEFPAYQLKDRR